ncbi:MAG: hypothetical protein K5889_02415 [Lachnospiraceae bacterium]|nr:hypothetical protein [Lachnospiraceae bacterium]
MSWYYDFYKIYKTKQEDVTLWNGRQSEDLPDHLRFLCEEYDDNDEHDGFEEIMEDILPINMYVEGKEYQGYLGVKNKYKLYPGKLRNIVFYHYQ